MSVWFNQAMNPFTLLRRSEKWTRRAERALLVIAIAWAVVRTGRSVGMLFDESHDLDIYQSLWFLLRHRDYAQLALSQALYLPHTWVVLTPLFMLGWPIARSVVLLLNIASVFFLWWRLSELAGLQGMRRWLLLAFIWGWLATGLVIGLGNLALVCVAALVAAYPFKTPTNSILLALAAMKQSLVFPVYFQLLFRRPKALLLPFVVFAVCGVGALWWARLSLAEGLKLGQGAMDTANSWTLYDFTCLRRLLVPFIKNGAALTIVMWLIWFGLFCVTWRFIREPLAQLAALLLLSLLPMYHQKYDLVAAAPLLAILFQRCSLVWPTLMTVSLAADYGSSLNRLVSNGPFHSFAATIELVYHPLLILTLFGSLVYLERKEERLKARVSINSETLQ